MQESQTLQPQDTSESNWRRVMSEIRWAWRNIVARRWRAVLTVGLLAAALAATTIVFSAADSLVFRRVAYPSAGRLVTFDTRDAKSGRPGGGFASAAVLDEWRKQTDVFAGVHGHLYKTIFLLGNGEPELVPAADVTPGLIDMLGVRPRWGRTLLESDTHRTDVHVVLIAEEIARERFGDPARSVDQRIETTAEPLLVVGVMPASFRFPDGTQRIWRSFDPRGPLARNTGISLVARVADGVSLTQLTHMMETRSEALYLAAGARNVLIASPAPLRTARVIVEQRRLLFVLLGAAISLLLTACANVASLELASALTRARTYAIQLAVGASRAALVRAGLLEGVVLVGTAGLAAFVLAYVATDALGRYLPVALTASVNPIDIDYRALLVTIGLAAVAWVLSSLPLVAFAWRANLLELLKAEGAWGSASRAGTVWRRVLTVAQVAFAVMLLVGSTLYVRSYLALLRLDKGFDSSGVVAITLTIPPQLLGSGAERAAMARTIVERLRGLPGVIGAFEGSPPPATGDSPTSNDHIEVDGRPPIETNILVPRLWVDPDYFRVLGIPLLAGRMFQPGDPPTNVIITEVLARRLWPDGDAVGHRFREDPLFEWSYVIGVVKHVRTTYDGTAGPERYFQKYSLRQPPPPVTAATAPTPRSSGAAYGFLTVTARVDSRVRASDLYQTVRSIDARNILKVEFVDDQYARQFADRLLATRIMTGFGMLAFVVAAAGIYGVMAFLVASRAREIGIRMALGADIRRIRGLVLASSMWLVLLGAGIGIGGAFVASRWAQSQLFGVKATDPLTIVLVTVAVALTALLATWHPARQATRVDPKVLLRN
jgi:putative ABC transport system permease protein